MDDRENAAERAAKLRAAQRAAEQEREENKANKRAQRKKNSRRRREAVAEGFTSFIDFIQDYWPQVLGVSILVLDIAACVLLALGVAWLPPIYDRIAVITFYVGIGLGVISVIFVYFYALENEFDFLCFAILTLVLTMVVLGAIVLFVIII